MKPVRINVTTRIIKQAEKDCGGHRSSTRHCIVATAIRKKLLTASINVGVVYATINKLDYILPLVVQKKIHKWVCRKVTQPFSFTMRLP